MIPSQNNKEIENLDSLKEETIQKDINSFQKMKIELSANQQENQKLRREIESLKESNSLLRAKNLDLLNLIKIYKSKEFEQLAAEDNLKNMKNEYEDLKDSLLKERANFRFELRQKDNVYNQDIIQTNLRTESLKHQVENFNGMKKLNDILYIKNNELKKYIEEIKYNEKAKLEELEIKYNKKMNNYKRKMIEFLKRNEEERAKNGTQSELNNKLNILHIQELVNEIEIQGVEVEDLLKERQELKFKILQLNRDLNIYQQVFDIMMRKNNTFQNKLKSLKNNNNIKEYNSLSSNKTNKTNQNSYNLLTEPQKNTLNVNVVKLKKHKYKGYTQNEKFLKIIKEKYVIKTGNKKILNTETNKINKEENDTKDNKDDINNKSFKDYIHNKNRDKMIEYLFQEREKYKDSSQFYKDKLDVINSRYSNIMKMYKEILEKIYKEELEKNAENIILNLDEFKKFNFEQMKPEQKYAILIKLINHISPLVYKADLENDSFMKNISKTKEKYKVNSFNISSQNSTKTPSQINDIINLKSFSNNSNNMKDRKRFGCFSDYKKFLKKDKNKTLYKFSNSKISIDLLPKVDLLDL